ncbi:unknown [Mycoplasma sp. CAG:776]|nr:unknown [Mycoplasma sp. CAG:776]
MKFLEKFGFEKKDIEALKENSTSALIKELEAHKKLVSKNLEYLNDMGVTNLTEIFVRYHDMFLMDNSNFVEIFNKYDQKDLVSKLAKNVQIMEYL